VLKVKDFILTKVRCGYFTYNEKNPPSNRPEAGGDEQLKP